MKWISIDAYETFMFIDIEILTILFVLIMFKLVTNISQQKIHFVK